MQEPTYPIDPFVGSWDLFPQLLGGSNRIEIVRSAQNPAAGFTHVATLHGESHELTLDSLWNQLKNDRLCLSLHIRPGRLFGLLRDAGDEGAYRPFTGRKVRSIEANEPSPGDGEDPFSEMTEGLFCVREVHVQSRQRPVEIGTLVGLVRNGTSFQLFAYPPAADPRLIDTLVPDPGNGTLSSLAPCPQGTVRTLTLWRDESGGACRRRLFSMVAVPTEGPPDENEPGDPLIVWGADDGGGQGGGCEEKRAG